MVLKGGCSSRNLESDFRSRDLITIIISCLASHEAAATKQYPNLLKKISNMKAVYRNKLILRMGGEPGFDFLVETYCENIQDDGKLHRLFGNFDLHTLISWQKELLLVSFLEPYEETEPRKKRVMFRNDMMGIDGSIFPLLEKHFVDALEDCCIEGLDFELCKAYFSELHALFKDCSNHAKYRENIVELMGGESIFDFLVLSYCERLEDDERLSCFFEDLDSQAMIRLQKELILMAFLHPKNANNHFEALRQRVTSAFSPLFELGISEEHFKMMESHFSAAVYECLSGPTVIQSCLRLFGNLIAFFEDKLVLSNTEYGGEHDDESEFSDETDEFDEEDDDSVFSECYGDDSSQPPIPHPEEMGIQSPRSRSERSSSSDNIMLLYSSEQASPKKGSVLLDVPFRPEHSISPHSRRSYVSKRIQAVLDRSSPTKNTESERTDDTVSIRSADGEAVIHPTMSSKGRRKSLRFSWKKRCSFFPPEL